LRQPAKNTDNETTEILYGAENIIKFNLQRFTKIKEKHDACLGSLAIGDFYSSSTNKNSINGFEKKGQKAQTHYLDYF
jgi:hypothetical protein